MIDKRTLKYFVGICGTVLFFSGCGSSSSSTTEDLATADTTTSVTVPGDLAVSSPLSSTATTSSLSAKHVAKQAFAPRGDKPGDPQGEHFEAKREALQTLIGGEGECGFTLTIPNVSSPLCYGPTLDYVGHPDATGDDEAEGPNGDLPSGDLGIWDESQGDEACAAAKMNELISKVASKVDNAINVFGVMACAGKKADIALPAEGSSVNMASVMDAQMDVPGLTVSSATIERLDDDSDGNTVYASTVSVTMGFTGDTRTGTMILKHIPTSADNSTYKGKLSFTMATDNAMAGGGNCDEVNTQSGLSGAVEAGVIRYEKTSSTSLVYQVDFAQFCGKTADPFDANNNILPSDKAVAATNPNGWADNWNHGIFSFNPVDGTGTVAYAWQAGALDGYTRVLNAETSVTDGVGSGTAYFGFGPDIATDAGRATIDGMFCNWAGPNNKRGNNGNIGVSELAQRQTLSRAAGGTVFTAASSDITFAPSNSCDANAGDGFTYSAQGVPESMDNDRTNDAVDLDNDLIATSEIDFTVPTAPADVGGSS